MKITVFGATGRTGRHVLAVGLSRHHEVVAATCRPQLLDARASLAGVVHGDGRDPAVVRQAIAGADAVISTVAGGTGSDPHQAADVSQTIVRVMTDLGVRRLVVTSAYPVVADRPRLVVAMLRRLLATAYEDVMAMERIVRASDLDWTIVRLTRLSNGPARGQARLSSGLVSGPRAISRADAAAVLLDIAEDDGHARTAINVSGGRNGRRGVSPRTWFSDRSRG